MKKAKKRKSQTRIAMVSITFVVGVLFVGMMGKSVALQDQLSSYDSQIKKLDQQIEEEEGRTTEIDDLKEYMKTDEYVEETAREKLGLVKENEIVFKEGDTEENTQDTDSSEGTQNSQDTQNSENNENSQGSTDSRSNEDSRSGGDSQSSGNSRNGNTSRETGSSSEEAEG